MITDWKCRIFIFAGLFYELLHELYLLSARLTHDVTILASIRPLSLDERGFFKYGNTLIYVKNHIDKKEVI